MLLYMKILKTVFKIKIEYAHFPIIISLIKNIYIYFLGCFTSPKFCNFENFRLFGYQFLRKHWRGKEV